MMTSTIPEVAIAALGCADFASVDTVGCVTLLKDAHRVRGWLDSVEAKITARAGVLHAAGNSVPAADLLTRCGGVSAAEGRRKDERSKTISDAPSFGDALATGSIGAEHVDALAGATSRLDDTIKTALLDQEADLLAAAESLSPEKFGRHVRDRARLLETDHGIERNRQQRKQTFITHRINQQTGMHEGRFALHPELGTRIFGAIDQQVQADVKAGIANGDTEYINRSVDRNQLAAEALGTLVAAGHGELRPAEADITVIVDHQTLRTGECHDQTICETHDGAILPPDSVRRLLCNGRITPVYLDADGSPFNLGRTRRTANRAQRRALRAIYHTCAFHGCDVAFHRCEIHHILPWELGGPTDLINLLPICSRHHHLIHEVGWRLDLAPDRTLTVTQPDGTIWATTRPDLHPNGRPANHALANSPPQSQAPAGSRRSTTRADEPDRTPSPRGEQTSLLAG